MRTQKEPNQLIQETSPYLLQHAYNPVDWHPWGDLALHRAKEENKPIFLSIGYSACHWCHVMERESFENQEIAAFLNEHFINIKVDREERPDLDEIYMSAVQALTESGGWPLSVFLLPNQKPFFGGTYFPPEDRYGRPGFLRILQGVVQAYSNNRHSLEESADSIISHIQEMMKRKGNEEIQYDWINNAKKSMLERFDSINGGFGGAPKFPHSMDLGLLLRDYKQSRDPKALQMVEFTLQKMAHGGMYDQLSGGFHRYSVDESWLIPHFEKMLYDNALLAKIYVEAYQVTRNPLYERIARETLDYVLREMVSPCGGFYVSQDADSEGGEGSFFVWTREEIFQTLETNEAEMFCRYYGVEEQGNFEEASSVLHVQISPEHMEKEWMRSWEEISGRLAESQKKLFRVREQRPKPATDTKILTDWNGLMISALAYAGGVFQEPRYLQSAENAAEYLWLAHWNEGELFHTLKKPGDPAIKGFLSDYAFMADSLLDLYQASSVPKWLLRAQLLIDKMIKVFWDEKEGGFFFSDNHGKESIVDLKSAYDTSVPSGNSVAMMTLLRFYGISGHEAYYRKAETGIKFFFR